MPELKNYTAPGPQYPASGGRRATAEDFGVGGIGASGRALSSAADQLLQSTEEEEARKALVQSTQIRATYARKLDEAAASGADLATLKQQMVDDLAKVGQDFQTKRGSEQLNLYTANSEIMFDQQANHIEASRAAAQARVQGAQFLSNASGIIQQNTAYLPEAEKGVDALMSTFTKLPPDQRAEIGNRFKQELNMAAALASARVDPEGTKKKLEAGAWNLSPEHRQTALNFADTEKRAARAEEAYIRAEDERQRRDRANKAEDQLFAGIMSGAGGMRRAIMDNAEIDTRQRQHLIGIMEERAKRGAAEERRSNPAVVRDLTLDIYAPEGDPRRIFNGDKIFEAMQKGDINVTDGTRLMSMVANQRDVNNQTLGTKTRALVSNMQRAFSQDPKYTGQPDLVASIQNQYVADVEARIAQRRAENKNPADLFDPTNKDYVGSREFIAQSVTTAQASRQTAATTTAAGTEIDKDGVRWRFKGGNPAEKKNWEELGPSQNFSAGKIGR